MNKVDKMMWNTIGECFKEIDKCNNEICEAIEDEKQKQDQFVKRIQNYKDRIKQLKGGN